MATAVFGPPNLKMSHSHPSSPISPSPLLLTESDSLSLYLRVPFGSDIPLSGLARSSTPTTVLALAAPSLPSPPSSSGTPQTPALIFHGRVLPPDAILFHAGVRNNDTLLVAPSYTDAVAQQRDLPVGAGSDAPVMQTAFFSGSMVFDGDTVQFYSSTRDRAPRPLPSYEAGVAAVKRALLREGFGEGAACDAADVAAAMALARDSDVGRSEARAVLMERAMRRGQEAAGERGGVFEGEPSVAEMLKGIAVVTERASERLKNVSGRWEGAESADVLEPVAKEIGAQAATATAVAAALMAWIEEQRGLARVEIVGGDSVGQEGRGGSDGESRRGAPTVLDLMRPFLGGSVRELAGSHPIFQLVVSALSRVPVTDAPTLLADPSIILPAVRQPVSDFVRSDLPEAESYGDDRQLFERWMQHRLVREHVCRAFNRCFAIARDLGELRGSYRQGSVDDLVSIVCSGISDLGELVTGSSNSAEFADLARRQGSDFAGEVAERLTRHMQSGWQGTLAVLEAFGVEMLQSVAQSHVLPLPPQLVVQMGMSSINNALNRARLHWRDREAQRARQASGAGGGSNGSTSGAGLAAWDGASTSGLTNGSGVVGVGGSLSAPGSGAGGDEDGERPGGNNRLTNNAGEEDESVSDDISIDDTEMDDVIAEMAMEDAANDITPDLSVSDGENALDSVDFESIAEELADEAATRTIPASSVEPSATRSASSAPSTGVRPAVSARPGFATGRGAGMVASFGTGAALGRGGGRVGAMRFGAAARTATPTPVSTVASADSLDATLSPAEAARMRAILVRDATRLAQQPPRRPLSRGYRGVTEPVEPLTAQIFARRSSELVREALQRRESALDLDSTVVRAGTLEMGEMLQEEIVSAVRSRLAVDNDFDVVAFPNAARRFYTGG